MSIPWGAFSKSLAQWSLGGILVPVVLLAIVLAASFPGFATSFNIFSLLSFVAVTGIVGLSQMSVLAIGQFNLALAAVGAFSAMLLGWLLQDRGAPLVLAVLAALTLAAGLGAVQGLLIVGLRLNPFMVTLGLASVFSGLMFTTLGNRQFQDLGPSVARLGTSKLGPVPLLLVLSLSIAAAVWYLMHRTVLGRELLATGENPLAALFSAVNTSHRVVAAHVLSCTLAGAAAVLLVIQLQSAQPAVGRDWLLPSFAAPILGGTLLSGGRVSIAGTMLGALLLAMVANALIIAGVSQYWYQAGLGVVILLAVGVEIGRSRLFTRGAT